MKRALLAFTALVAVTTPALFSAMIARNSPMPTVMAMRIERGMPSTMIRRRPVSVTTMKSRPEMNTAPSAACQV